MKNVIEVNRRDFIALLKCGGVFSGRNKALPILENVRCVTKGQRIRVESTDGDNVMRVYGGLLSVGGDDIRFCVSARDLLNILSLVCDDTVSLEIDADERKEIVVRHARGKSVLPYLGDEDYPASPVTGDDVIKKSVPSGVLSRWLSVAVDFVANDTLRPVMNGVLLYGENGRIGVAASDGLKLFSSECDDVDTPEFRVIVSRAAASALAANIATADADVELAIGTGVVVFTTPSVVITSRLIEGRYPNIKSVIPHDSPYTLTFNRADMIAGVRRLLPSSGMMGCVRIDTDGTFMKVTSEDYDFHKSGEEIIAFNGDNVAPFGLKGPAFLQVLSSFDDDEAVMGVSSPERAVLISRQGDDGCHDSFVIMPMVIS